MSVFGAAYADQYDSLYAAKDYRQECNLIDSAVQRFAKFPTKSIVDIGCELVGMHWNWRSGGMRWSEFISLPQ